MDEMFVKVLKTRLVSKHLCAALSLILVWRKTNHLTAALSLLSCSTVAAWEYSNADRRSSEMWSQ